MVLKSEKIDSATQPTSTPYFGPKSTPDTNIPAVTISRFGIARNICPSTMHAAVRNAALVIF